MSEPEFLLSVMDRHDGWAVLICLIGGGQEINTGEAGLAEWFRVLEDSHDDWHVFVSDVVDDSEHMDDTARELLRGVPLLHRVPNLHLSTSIRSFRAERLSALVKALLDCDEGTAVGLVEEVLTTYPICLTRSAHAAKSWLRARARGTERFGMAASSEARRLKPIGINVNAKIEPEHWFLDKKDDVRSSFYLEDVATEFQIQGLELDWTCVAWGGDLRFDRIRGDWEYHCFRGTRWQRINDEIRRKYLKNAYRVVLTRARQGMVILVPEGDSIDCTHPSAHYDPTFEYLKGLGIPEISEEVEE
jgi:hypothetical protein